MLGLHELITNWNLENLVILLVFLVINDLNLFTLATKDMVSLLLYLYLCKLFLHFSLQRTRVYYVVHNRYHV